MIEKAGFSKKKFLGALASGCRFFMDGEDADFPALGVSQDAGVAEHAGVEFGFLLEFHGVGA